MLRVRGLFVGFLGLNGGCDPHRARMEQSKRKITPCFRGLPPARANLRTVVGVARAIFHVRSGVLTMPDEV